MNATFLSRFQEADRLILLGHRAAGRFDVAGWAHDSLIIFNQIPE